MKKENDLRATARWIRTPLPEMPFAKGALRCRQPENWARETPLERPQNRPREGDLGSFSSHMSWKCRDYFAMHFLQRYQQDIGGGEGVPGSAIADRLMITYMSL